MTKSTIKLDPLPNRKPVKLTLTLDPEVFDALEDYARIYAEQYGNGEPVHAIAASMISGFMDSDAAFRRARKNLLAGDASAPAYRKKGSAGVNGSGGK